MLRFRPIVLLIPGRYVSHKRISYRITSHAARVNQHLKILCDGVLLQLQSVCSTTSVVRCSHNTALVEEDAAVRLIRNVGVIAHIDAGKTTTTERMLYFAHRTHHLGEVDRGDTVTDYLPEERDRGISIVSAAACLTWKRHTLHLLDTPGHVDFTMEVERSLSVMDGAIAILDGTEGVQAQTRTVWHQADRYHLPRLVYVNKMDRDAASLERSLATLSAQLIGTTTRYVAIHWPVFTTHLSSKLDSGIRKETFPIHRDGRNRFVGLVDLTSMKLKDWSNCSSPDTPFAVHDLLMHGGNESTSRPVFALSPEAMRAAMSARTQLFGTLADVDEEFADQFLSLDNPEVLITSESVRKALRRATLSGRIVPVMVGSSRQSIGVQPLLDGIVHYLPDPSQRGLPDPVHQALQRLQTRPPPASSTERIGSTPSGKARPLISSSPGPLMLVFKVCFDPHRGPLSLVRVYSGTIKAGCTVTNWSQRGSAPITEKVQTVFQLTGDHHDVVERAGPGSIVALAGLQSTHSGDLLGPSTRLDKSSTENATTTSAGPMEDYWMTKDNDSELGFPALAKREPVVYAAIEPASLSGVRNLEHALMCMQREDPSFTAHLDPETGQWAIGGMGDLHLEVIMSRLKREYKVDARMGPLVIAYKECPLATSSSAGNIVRGYGRSSGLVEGRERAFLIELVVETSGQKTPQVKFDRLFLGPIDSIGSEEPQGGSQNRIRQTVRQACLQALQVAGPLLRSPVIGINVTLRRLWFGRLDQITGTTEPERLDQNHLRLSPRLLINAQAIVPLVRAATTAAITNALKNFPSWCLMEPMVQVELRLPVDQAAGQGESLSRFLGDLSSRRAEIEAIDAADPMIGVEKQEVANRSHLIRAMAPLAEMVGYSGTVRTMSSGRAELHLRLSEYRPVSADHQTELLSKFRWTQSTL